MHLNNLRPESDRHGLYLLRAILPPLGIAGTLSILESELGDAVMLQIHREDEDIQPVFEERVCIIKESWYIMITNGCYGMRVDHVSDVTWLPKADGRMALEWRPQSDGIAIMATQLKDNGNDARKMGKQLRPSNLKLSFVHLREP